MIKEKPSHYQRYEDVYYCEECRWLMKGEMH